jgi:DNA-binding LacI/PurR family transcriptional regulator
MPPAKARRSLNRRVTVRDVAARAGVSQPTVSLVLGGHPRARVAADTRERIMQAAAELGYRPNVIARGLARRRSYAIGLLVPDLRNPFYAEIVSGAERVAAQEGYAVLLCDASEVGPHRHLETLRERLVDGIILDAVGASELGEAAFEGLNVVLIDEPSGRVPFVASDAMGAGRTAAAHLIGLGHRRVAYMGPAADVYAFRMRERGFVQAMRSAGATFDSDRLRRAPATVAGGMAAMRAMLALGAGRPTAVFCANDLMAVGALKACAAAGVVVPRDLSVVGCDDIELATLVTPELTTIAVPARELGARAARTLCRQLAGEAETRAVGRALPRALPVKLVVRGTTAVAPTAAPTGGAA